MSNQPREGNTGADFAAAVQEYYKNERADYNRAFQEVFGEPPDLHFREEEQSSSTSIITGEMPIRDEGNGSGAQNAGEGTKDSGASTSQGSPGSGSGAKATAQDHQAMPGPVIAENLPPAASKEELRKRAEELNKK